MQENIIDDAEVVEALEALRKAVINKAEKVKVLENKITKLSVENAKMHDFIKDKENEHISTASSNDESNATDDIDLSISELKKIIKKSK